MCGILGGISIRPLEFLRDPARLDAAIDCLAHRGPDDRGAFIASDRTAFLGHRRLSIIDVAGGHQPLVNEKGDTRLCYNGEIYNFRSLQAPLRAAGHTLRTAADGEVALHGYEDEPDCFEHRLSGMFAIAVLDSARRRLTLVRDRNGIKPLYYHHDGSSLVFASELKAILGVLPSRPAISACALREYLRWKFVPAPLSIFENIYKLPPAHRLIAEPDGDRLRIESTCYWDPDFSAPHLADEDEAIEQLDQLLRRAVESHLESDVEVGALLSGGVDSSLVVALASIISKRRIKTFSVGFEETGFDQLPFARIIANKYNTEHFEEHVRLDPMEAVQKLVHHFDEPFADSSALACASVCETAAKHVKVVLTGDGGDESFAGYNRYEGILNASESSPGRRLLDRAVILTSSALFSPEAKYLKRFRERLESPLDRHETHQLLFGPWLADRLLAPAFRPATNEPGAFHELRSRALARGWQPIQVAQYVDLRMSLPDDMLTKVDRTSMAFSLECRVPILDHPVTEFSARLSPHLKVRGGIRKYLLKKVAERYVPPELLYRQKMGFRVPIRRWFKSKALPGGRDLLAETEKLVLTGRLVERGILDPGGLRWMFRAQRRPWIDFGSQLWALLFLETWARRFL